VAPPRPASVPRHLLVTQLLIRRDSSFALRAWPCYADVATHVSTGQHIPRGKGARSQQGPHVLAAAAVDVCAIEAV